MPTESRDLPLGPGGCTWRLFARSTAVQCAGHRPQKQRASAPTLLHDWGPEQSSSSSCDLQRLRIGDGPRAMFLRWVGLSCVRLPRGSERTDDRRISQQANISGRRRETRGRGVRSMVRTAQHPTLGLSYDPSTFFHPCLRFVR
jgi:hypothetical protein